MSITNLSLQSRPNTPEGHSNLPEQMTSTWMFNSCGFCCRFTGICEKEEIVFERGSASPLLEDSVDGDVR